MVGCNCPKTIAYLRSIGAVHAAAMHERGAAGKPYEWSGNDWLAHMVEEEQLLFQRFPAHIARVLTEDHMVFRQEIGHTGQIQSVDRLARHSEIEDAWIGVLLAG